MFLFLVGSKSNVSAVFWLRFRMVWALFLSLFNGFQQRRFGIFPATVSQWLGHKTCWGSAFSHARPKHLFLEFGLVACRLPSLTLRKGLLCLRRLFFFVFSRFQKQRFGSFLAAVSINTKGLEYPRNLSAVTKPLFRPSAPNFAVSSVRGRRHERQPFNNLNFCRSDLNSFEWGSPETIHFESNCQEWSPLLFLGRSGKCEKFPRSLSVVSVTYFTSICF